MLSTRAYRLIEGSFIAAFLLQAIRVVFGVLLGMTSQAVISRQVSLLTVNSHLILAAAIALPWFSPRGRTTLPRTLMVSAAMATVARVLVSIEIPFLRLAAGCAVIGFASVYFASLLRANWRTWASVLVLGMLIDQLLRAQDTYDLSLRAVLRITIGDAVVNLPWLILQIGITIAVLFMAWQARRNARLEPYEPALLDVWGGLALGGFLVLELLVLGVPSVIGRWTGVSYSALVPWILLATALPLVPLVHESLSQFLKLFDERLRGWILLLLILLSLVAGNRLGTAIGAGAMVLAQFLVILLLWWIPSPNDTIQVEQVGPSTSLAVLTAAVGIYIYGLSSEVIPALTFLRGQSLTVVLICAILVAFPRLWWRERDPWQHPTHLKAALPVAFCTVVVVSAVIMSSAIFNSGESIPMNTLRVATYNITSGYDGQATFQLELIARTIEASQADVVILQEADTGRPAGYEIDQVEYLARRLRMYQVYQAGYDKLLGVAVLSKRPIGSSSRLVLADAEQSAGAVRIHLEDTQLGRAVDIVGTQITGADEQARLRQLASILGMIGDASPVIIGVDTERPPEDTVYQQLTAAGFVDPDVALGIERGFTFPASNPTVRRDYLFVRGMVPLASRQVDRSGSQHRLVVIEVGWP